MDNLNYELSPIAKYRAGTPTDPYIKINGQQKVINQRIQLPEIPVDKMKVLITGYVEADARQGNFLSSNRYKVDYNEGIVHFAPEAEGQTITYEFYGKGTHYIASSRVWIEHNNGEVTKTLKDIVDTGETALENIEKLNKVIDEAETVITEGNLVIERIDQTNQTVTQAESLRVTAEDARVAQENVRETNEEDRQATELLRDTAEEERKQAETIRKQAETTREANEDTRIANENIRLSQEATRQAQEETRQTQEQARQDSTEAALSNLQDKMDKIVFLGEYVAAKQYYPWNCVSYNGSSYICMKESFGIAPTNTTYWNLLAQKGIDGTGTGTVMEVKSSNGDIIVDNATTTPTLTLNVGEGANQIVRRDANGNISGVSMDEINDKISSIEAKNAEQDTAISDYTDLINQHIADTDSHITAEERTVWNAKETTDGAQSKADQAKQDAIIYVNGQIKESESTGVILSTGISTVNSDRDVPINLDWVQGKTLINILGTNGNCENITSAKWTSVSDAGSPTFTVENGAIKIVTDSTENSFARISRLVQPNTLFETGKYYIAAARVKCSEVDKCKIYVGKSGAMFNKTTDWETIYVGFYADEVAKWIVLGEISSPNTTTYIDDIRIYEISMSTFFGISNMSPQEIEGEFPYVEGMTNVKNPYAIITNENLLPPLYEWSLVQGSGYDIEYSTSGGVSFSKLTDSFTTFEITVPIDSINNKTFTLEFVVNIQDIVVGDGGVGLYYNTYTLDAYGEIIDDLTSPPFLTTDGTFRFTRNFNVSSKAKSMKIIIGANPNTSGSFRINCVMLNAGSTASEYQKQRSSVSAFECELAAEATGNNADILYIGDDGLPYVVEKWGKIELDGSLDWAWSAGTYSGFKRVGLAFANINAITGTQIVTKFDGTPLIPFANNEFTTGDQAILNTSYSILKFQLSINNADSGWGDGYTPTADEIKAYFLGWKMYDTNNADASNIYNRTDGAAKGWVYRAEEVPWSPAVTSVPTVQAPVTSKWRPYKLQYLKAAPTVVPVKNYELGAALYKGTNTVEVSSGIVIRERANPYLGDDAAVINSTFTGEDSSILKHKVKSILRTYRHNAIDLAWNKQTGSSYGIERLHIKGANYDKTAVYHVTYTMLSPTLSASFVGTVSTNIGGIVDDAIQDIKGLKQRVSVIENKKADVDALSRITPTLLNGWNYTGDSRRSFYIKEGNRVFVSLAIYNGTKTKGTVLTKIPYKLDSFVAQDHVGVTYNSETDIEPVGFIHGLDGTISIGACNNGTSKTFIFAEFSYITND